MKAPVEFASLGFVLFTACSNSDAPPVTPAGDGGPSCAMQTCEDAPVTPGDDGSTGTDVPQPPNTVLVSDPEGDYANQLGVSAGYLYWIGGTKRIVRAPTAGGAATTLFVHPSQDSFTVEIGGMVVDDTAVYFTDPGDMGQRGLYKMPLDGSTPPALVVEGVASDAIADDGDDLCFVDGDAIRYVKKSGGAATTLVRGIAGYRTQIAVSAGFVYFQAALEGLAEEVYRIPLTAVAPDPDAGSDAGGPQPEKVSVVPGRYTLTLYRHVDQGFVYWGALDSIFRASATSAATEIIPGTNEFNTSPPDTLYAHQGVVYWVKYSASGISQQAVPDGMLSMVPYAPAVGALVADDTSLYGAAGPDIHKFPLLAQ
jgi:hypothetical protein